MVRLQSFTLVGTLLRDFADDPSEDDGGSDEAYDGDDVSLAVDDQKSSPLQCLMRCEKLKDLVLVSIEIYDTNDFTWRLPLFRNLRTLILLGLERSSYEGNVDDIAEVLLSSPQLTSLGLSLRAETGIGNDMLQKLITYYQSGREDWGTSQLRLSELRLGLGFLPCIPQGGSLEGDYLDQLTNLAVLTKLHINNSNLDPNWAVLFWRVEPSFFASATALREISVERLSLDIVELIEIVKRSNPEIVTLDEIEVSRYFETIETIEQEEYNPNFDFDYQGQPLYSLPLEQTGLHWRRISYGTKLKNDDQNMADHVLHSFVAQCLDLEELCIPMTLEQLGFFKSSILPNARRLHTLMIPRGHIADLIPLVHSTRDRENSSKRIKLHQIEEHHNIECEHEELRIALATDIFAFNRHLILKNPEIVPLQYIGVGTHVYCCMLPIAGLSKNLVAFSIERSVSDETKSVDEFQVFKLSQEQAGQFESVRRLGSEDVSFL